MKAATELPDFKFTGDVFQSTPPVKAATEYMGSDFAGSMISIHAAREGGDRRGGMDATPTWSFQSTPPVKAATM